MDASVTSEPRLVIFHSKMLEHFLLAFVVSTAGYGVAVALIYARGKDERCYIGWRRKLAALQKAVDIANFSNAVIASVLSSWALYRLEEKFLVRGGRSGDGFLADCVLGTVCGYIAMEVTVVSLASFSYRRNGDRLAMSYLWHIYREMVLFHAVAFVGLSSVVFRDRGYPVALWVVWSELTTVFIGLENFTSGSYRLRLLSKLWGQCASLLFVVQRVLLFYYLLWQSWRSFVWETGFVCQMGVLLAGTLLNTHMAWDFITN